MSASGTADSDGSRKAKTPRDEPHDNAAGAADSKQAAKRQAVERTDDDSNKRRLRVAVICSSNQNRSMEAHNLLQKRGMDVKSYGTGALVRLPGPSVDQPNCYEFGQTTYREMYEELRAKDESLYTANGILNMLERNMRIKEKPQRFQGTKERFDVIISCEGKVYDQIIEEMQSREVEENEPVHICNFEIKDNHDSATVGAIQIHRFLEKLSECEDLDDEFDDVVQAVEEDTNQTILHTVAFY